MNTLSGLLKQHDDMLASILQSAPIALRGLANATGTGNALEINFPNGLWSTLGCAPSAAAPKQFGMIEYYKRTASEARQGVRDPGDRRRPGDQGWPASTAGSWCRPARTNITLIAQFDNSAGLYRPTTCRCSG